MLLLPPVEARSGPAWVVADGFAVGLGVTVPAGVAVVVAVVTGVVVVAESAEREVTGTPWTWTNPAATVLDVLLRATPPADTGARSTGLRGR